MLIENDRKNQPPPVVFVGERGAARRTVRQRLSAGPCPVKKRLGMGEACSGIRKILFAVGPLDEGLLVDPPLAVLANQLVEFVLVEAELV